MFGADVVSAVKDSQAETNPLNAGRNDLATYRGSSYCYTI